MDRPRGAPRHDASTRQGPPRELALTSVPSTATSAAATSSWTDSGLAEHRATRAPPAPSVRTRLAVSAVTCRHAASAMPSSGRSRSNRVRSCESTGICSRAHPIRASPSSASERSATSKSVFRARACARPPAGTCSGRGRRTCAPAMPNTCSGRTCRGPRRESPDRPPDQGSARRAWRPAHRGEVAQPARRGAWGACRPGARSARGG